jgi:hypothetical protein
MRGPAALDVSPISEGLWGRLRDEILAERRLERFAFGPEGAEGPAAARLSGLAGDAGARAGVARDMALRALAAAADDVNFRLLSALGDAAPMALDEVARAVNLPALAVAERLGALSHAGLARRDLERDGAEATPAGRGMVRLVRTLCAGLEERLDRDLPALLGP